jgi:hypothetical protein
MLCTHCGHNLSHEEQQFCTQCGTPVKKATPASHQLRALLEDSRVRDYLPGRSFLLLGAVLVGLALVLSLVPGWGGIGLTGSVLVLMVGAMAVLYELHALSQPRPREVRAVGRIALYPALERLPVVVRHRYAPRVFSLLTCTYALLTLGTGGLSLLWLPAALVLAFDQAFRLAMAERREAGGDAGDFRQKLELWLAGAAGLCALALFFSWGRSSTWGKEMAGRDQPLAVVTQAVLIVLGVLPFLRKGLKSVPGPVPPLMAVWLTFWFLMMMSPYAVGPWLFMAGLLVIDAVVVMRFLRDRGLSPIPRMRRPSEGHEEPYDVPPDESYRERDPNRYDDAG